MESESSVSCLLLEVGGGGCGGSFFPFPVGGTWFESTGISTMTPFGRINLAASAGVGGPLLAVGTVGWPAFGPGGCCCWACSNLACACLWLT